VKRTEPAAGAFHAPYLLITNLATAGVHPKHAQALAQHFNDHADDGPLHGHGTSGSREEFVPLESIAKV